MYHDLVPWYTMLPHLAGMIDPELWFAKRCIKFISMCMKSDNNIVKTISMIGVNGLYFVLGALSVVAEWSNVLTAVPWPLMV